MRVAVISDVHGNLHALDAVRDAIADDGVDEIWHLGDAVGYGPFPNECCQTLEGWASLSLCGNHDLGAIGLLPVAEFSPLAAAAISWTKEELSAETRDWLSSLAPSSRAASCELYHGSPSDPVWEYVLTEEGIEQAFAVSQAPIVLVGHTHLAAQISSLRGELDGGLAPAGTECDLSEGRWLLNPGSVGQPRDGDPRAAYLLLDLDARRAEFRRVDYPVQRTQEAVMARGLPEQLATRLTRGL